MLDRNQLPQIPVDQLPRFIAFLRSQRVTVERRNIAITELRPMQKHVNKNKIRSLLKKPDALRQPLLVAKGNIVVDGHHRWLAHAVRDASASVNCIYCDVDPMRLAEMGHEFDGSLTKGIHEQLCELLVTS